MSYRKHSPEEIAWVNEKVKHVSTPEGGISTRRISELKLVKEYKEKFGKQLTVSGLSFWIRRVSNPEKYQYKKKPSGEAIFDRSNFILSIHGVGVYGFETEDEVKAFISESKMILATAKLFKSVPLTINVKIDIG